MKLKLLLLCFVSPIFCISQEWGANHAVWHYSQTSFMPPFHSPFIKYTAIDDTTILGENAKIINVDFVSISDTVSSQIIMNSDSGRVYFFVPEINEFRQVYDFNAMPGDTIAVYCPYYPMQDSTINIFVDSVSTIQINGRSLKVQHVSQLFEPDDEFLMNGEIIENIGWTGFMFPLHAWADPPTGGPIRCFQNDSISVKFSDISCDYLKDENSYFLVENKTWVYQLGGDFMNPGFYDDLCYTVGEDTIIQDITYKKLLVSPGCDELNYIVAFIRETADNKVYYRYNSLHGTEEFLLYDFEMEIGDTTYTGIDNGFFILDSIGFNDDDSKLYYVTDSRLSNDIWIENVGSTSGLLKEVITGGSQIFTCCILDEELLYHNPAFTSCYYDGVFISEFDGPVRNQFNIFPNPAQNEVTISVPSNIEIKTVELLELSGRIIQQWSNLKPGDNVIGFDSVLPGIYLIKVKTDLGIITQKLIVR